MEIYGKIGRRTLPSRRLATPSGANYAGHSSRAASHAGAPKHGESRPASTLGSIRRPVERRQHLHNKPRQQQQRRRRARGAGHDETEGGEDEGERDRRGTMKQGDAVQHTFYTSHAGARTTSERISGSTPPCESKVAAT
ncbi:hypothetical protein VTO73DRAFT_12009 [Trametes versicolor]